MSVLCPGFVNTAIMSGDRNRPAAQAKDDDTRRTFAWPFAPDYGPSRIEPEIVAEHVLDAVRNDDFWILPNPDMLEQSWSRYEELRAIVFPPVTGMP